MVAIGCIRGNPAGHPIIDIQINGLLYWHDKIFNFTQTCMNEAAWFFAVNISMNCTCCTSYKPHLVCSSSSSSCHY